MSGQSKAVQPFAWKLPKPLPDNLRYVQMLRLPVPILNTLQSLLTIKPPAPKMTPVASLQDGLATFSAAILTFDNPLHKNNVTASWMYALNDFVPDVNRLKTLIEVWLRVCYGEQSRKLSKEWGRLDWDWSQVDLQMADDRLRRILLPGLVVRWLLQQGYTLRLDNGEIDQPFPLRLAPLMTRSSRAELISEPESYQDSLYSPVIRFRVEDVPDSGELMLMGKASVRRWLSRPLLNENNWLDMKIGRGKSVYLRRSPGYLDGQAHDDVFTRITLKCVDRGANGLRWMGYQARLFGELGLDGAPPDEQELARDPAKFQHIALLPMESRQFHQGEDAGAGLQPGDHQRVYRDLNACLQTCFEPMDLWQREAKGDIKPRTRTASQQKLKEKEIESPTQAAIRYEALRRMPEPMHIDLHVRDIENAKYYLLTRTGTYGMSLENLADNPLRVMDGERLLLEIRQGYDATLTDLLPELPSGSHDAHRNAVNARRAQIARMHQTKHPSAGMLVELTNYQEIPLLKQRDPKAAIRSGLLEAGRVSQFITPRIKSKHDNHEMRMKNAVSDLLRTLGYRLNPFYVPPVDLSLPAELDLIVFWMFQLNARNRSEQTVMLPVVVDVPFGHPHLRVFVPNEQISGRADMYPSLQAGIRAASRFDLDFTQNAEVSNFFADALAKRNSDHPALLMLSDQNLRRIYPELTGYASGQSQGHLYDALDDKPQIRLARLRFSRHDEAPFCTPGEKKGKYQGLYQHPDYPNTFYSLHNIGERHQSIHHRKLSRADAASANSSTLQIHLNNLQPGDVPADWAALVHRLRLESWHTDAATLLPQPMHDTQIIKDYLSRLADDDGDETEEDGDDVNGVDDMPGGMAS